MVDTGTFTVAAIVTCIVLGMLMTATDDVGRRSLAACFQVGTPRTGAGRRILASRRAGRSANAPGPEMSTPARSAAR